MVVIKHIPQDFVVDEVSDIEVSFGPFSYIEVKKCDVTTSEAARRIASALKISVNDVRCAGNKDRRAVTSQVCSVPVSVGELELDGVSVRCIGRGKKPVGLGCLKGNNFVVVVRDVDSVPSVSSRFLNLFGSQRFSVKNVEIGRLIVKRNFVQAAALIGESHQLVGSDAISLLRSLPRRILLLYVHAFQSFLWNEVALIRAGEENQLIPLVGFGSDLDEVSARVLEKEGLSLRDFIIREIPHISVEGGERSLYAFAENLDVSIDDDEFFAGKKKVTLKFFLPKGCYATEFIRQNFENN